MRGLFNSKCNAVPGIFQAELFGHCRDRAIDTSKTSCKFYPCKKRLMVLLLTLQINKWLCFPGLPGWSCQACCFCKQGHGFGDSPLTLYALANLLVFLEAFVGSTSETEKKLQTSKQYLSKSWETGAGTQIKHIQRFGNGSQSFNSWQGESRRDRSTERKEPANFPLKKIHQNASKLFELCSFDGYKPTAAPQFSITFHKVFQNYFYRKQFT